MPEPPMSNAAAIAAVKAGGRARTHQSLHESEDTTLSATCRHSWRVVACDGDTDVVECHRCGRQRPATCDFDEEYA